MEAIVIFIWIAVCLTACTIGVLTALFIARLAQGYTVKETTIELYDFLKGEDL